jgi:hypothetical protein
MNSGMFSAAYFHACGGIDGGRPELAGELVPLIAGGSFPCKDGAG